MTAAPIVFISYRHKHDGQFVAELADRLRKARYRPWVDLEQIPVGSELTPAIEKGLLGASCVVFVWSGWYDDEPEPKREQWCKKELLFLGDRAPATRRLLIARKKIASGSDISLRLADTRPLIWEPGADDDACFWNLHCGMEEVSPGPPAEWSAKGRALVGDAAPSPPRSRPSLVPRDDPRPPSDRSVYFNFKDQLDSLLERRGVLAQHQVVFVAGPRSYGHDHCLMRLSREGVPTPQVLPLDWSRSARPFPADEPTYRAALARTLGCQPDGVQDALERRLAGQELAIVHPHLRVQSHREDAPGEQLLAQWIPALVGALPVERRLWILQPVSWARASWLRRWLAVAAEALFPGEPPAWAAPALTARRGKKLVATRAGVPFLDALPELGAIDKGEVFEFLTKMVPDERERRALVREIFAGARTPDEILKNLGTALAEL